jgi:hypothetical protein
MSDTVQPPGEEEIRAELWKDLARNLIEAMDIEK